MKPEEALKILIVGDPRYSYHFDYSDPSCAHDWSNYQLAVEVLTKLVEKEKDNEVHGT
jgi:hypothetical protein